MSKTKINVVIGTEIKRESVLLDGNGNVIEEGEGSQQLLKKRYGKRKR